MQQIVELIGREAAALVKTRSTELDFVHQVE
jgi:hypothetical protein